MTTRQEPGFVGAKQTGDAAIVQEQVFVHAPQEVAHPVRRFSEELLLVLAQRVQTVLVQLFSSLRIGGFQVGGHTPDLDQLFGREGPHASPLEPLRPLRGHVAGGASW